MRCGRVRRPAAAAAAAERAAPAQGVTKFRAATAVSQARSARSDLGGQDGRGVVVFGKGVGHRNLAGQAREFVAVVRAVEQIVLVFVFRDMTIDACVVIPTERFVAAFVQRAVRYLPAAE